MKHFTILATLLAAMTAQAAPQFVIKEYDGFWIYLDCEHNGPVAYELWIGEDLGNFPRHEGNFLIDDDIPAECQMTSGATFQVTDAERAEFGISRGAI